MVGEGNLAKLIEEFSATGELQSFRLLPVISGDTIRFKYL